MSNPLDIGLSLKGIDTSFPSLGVGEVRAVCRGIEVKESQKTPGLYMLKVTHELNEPYSDSNGKELQPGFKTSSMISLPGQPGVPDDQEEMRKKSVAAFIDVCLDTTIDNRPDLSQETLDLCVGKEYTLLVKKSKDDSYGPTEIRGFKAIPKA